MSPDDLNFAIETARQYAGLKLRGDRAFHIETRLSALARREGLASAEALLDQLRSKPGEPLRRAVAEALSQGETSFFRDREVFERLQAEILPTLAKQRPDAPLRVLCAGCSTGQEVYSMALAARAAGIPVEILGVDLNERALEKAQAGIYTQFEVQRGLPIRMLITSFERIDEMWVVKPAIRQGLSWKRVNLVDDLSALGSFDLVLCRNVVSGLEDAARRRVLDSLSQRLADDGWLALGAQETAEETEGFLPGRGYGLHKKIAGPGRRAA